ncbi:MAG TPA: ATP-binding protein [Candidatus Acidoferrales bacterium]|nr:ATP-binding protein [Candidatus Acidoferrales bacterium]
MALSLRTKFTLATALLVLIIVALISGLYVVTLTRQVIRQADDRAGFIAQQVFYFAQHALVDASQSGETPRSSRPADVRAYIQHALEDSPGVGGLLESGVGYYRDIYEITISDHDGTALVSSDASLPGRAIARRPGIAQLIHANFIEQFRILYGPPRVYEETLPFSVGPQPFGDVRVGLSSALLRDEISPGLYSAAWLSLGAILLSTLFTAIVGQVSLAPLSRISRQLDRISAGEFDLEPVAQVGEFGQVSNKISRIGQQLRDVREIFSTLRENMNQIMAGLEDGLLLFNAEGRAMMISPSAYKFLGAKSDEMQGRKIEEVFPPGNPIAEALHIGDDGELLADAGEQVEVELASEAGARRVGVSVQAIREDGVRMGLLVTLRDLESLARIGSHLQVSERLAALGRVTAGVAHEVKNPLNSMRVWLEVLKGNLSPEPETQQAAKMLDTEIDRLDRVVKTFLEFSRPVEVEHVETGLPQLLESVLATAKPAIERGNIALVKDVPAEFPSVEIDHRLIEQAVLNLVLNACDCMRPGGRLNIGLRQIGEMAEISVGDTGPGIAPENRAKIFQLFFTTRKGGTGLGLANAFRFVQLHNGSIEFDTEAGRGTTFRISLPLPRVSGGIASKYYRDFGQPFARER